MRQDYREGTYLDAKTKGYDILQLKYDGWFDRIEIRGGKVEHYSRTGRLFKEGLVADLELHCTLIGEHMQGTQWSQNPRYNGHTYIFDCWMWDGRDLKTLPYKDRYKVSRLATVGRLPAVFKPVNCYRIDDFPQLWETQVVSGAFEGLVFKKSTDDTSGLILRQKMIVYEDLKCVGFSEGEGRLSGTLGAIQAVTEDGVRVDVGGGLSDETRREIFDNQPFYLNKWFEAEGRAKFESGSIRHPNFIKWRFDKS